MNDKADINQLTRRARNLSSISLAIIVFIVAGGVIPNKITIFGTGIFFERVGILLIAFFSMYVYYRYKYTLQFKYFKSKYWYEFNTILYENRDLHLEITNYLNDFYNSKKLYYEYYYQEVHNEYIKYIENTAEWIPDYDKLFTLYGDVWYIKARIYFQRQDASFLVEEVSFSISDLKINDVLYWSHIKLIKKDDTFSLLVIPNILYYMANSLIVFKLLCIAFGICSNFIII